MLNMILAIYSMFKVLLVLFHALFGVGDLSAPCLVFVVRAGIYEEHSLYSLTTIRIHTTYSHSFTFIQTHSLTYPSYIHHIFVYTNIFCSHPIHIHNTFTTHSQHIHIFICSYSYIHHITLILPVCRASSISNRFCVRTLLSKTRKAQCDPLHQHSEHIE